MRIYLLLMTQMYGTSLPRPKGLSFGVGMKQIVDLNGDNKSNYLDQLYQGSTLLGEREWLV